MIHPIIWSKIMQNFMYSAVSVKYLKIIFIHEIL